MKKITYAQISKAVKKGKRGVYYMSMVGDEGKLIESIVSQGIDAHLEACFIKGRDTYEWKKAIVVGQRLECKVSPESMPVLLRRLNEKETEDAETLCTDILETLEFKVETGCFEIVNEEPKLEPDPKPKGKLKPLWKYLTNGSSARGAQMGRSNDLPADTDAPIKLRIERLKFVDGDYDVKGAYWGGGTPIYFCRCDEEHIDQKGKFYPEVFVRAADLEKAKAEVRKLLPKATFSD